MFGFVNVYQGRSIEDIRPDTPFFIVRREHDETPRLNERLDRFATCSLAHDLPLTVVNLGEARHAFYVIADTENSWRGVSQIVEFMNTYLHRL